MTLYEAVKAELLQYSASKSTIDKALVDAGLEPSENYTAEYKINVARVVITILRRLVSLASENEGGFSQSYNVGELKKHLKLFAAENGLDDLVEDLSTDDAINDKSDIW